jgi:hypothetical protein
MKTTVAIASAVTVLVAPLFAQTRQATYESPSCQTLHIPETGDIFEVNATRHCDVAEGETKGPCFLAPLPGEIKIVEAKYGKVEGCNFWKAKTPSEAEEIVKDFDEFESHPPEVVYKSVGKYPSYTQLVVKGGCPPNSKKLNCQD